MEERSNIPLLAKVAGFSLHPVTVCEAYQRSRLECLCRYITRPPIATKRLSVDGRGRVVYQYKRPFRDGSTHMVLEPLPTYELSQFRLWPDGEQHVAHRALAASDPKRTFRSRAVTSSQLRQPRRFADRILRYFELPEHSFENQIHFEAAFRLRDVDRPTLRQAVRTSAIHVSSCSTPAFIAAGRPRTPLNASVCSKAALRRSPRSI